MADPAIFLPRELADRWRCSLDAVYGLIHAGQLRAFQISPPGAKRPSYRIPADAVVQYESRQVSETPAKPKRRRKKSRPEGWVQYF
jgi:hypothetical protein